MRILDKKFGIEKNDLKNIRTRSTFWNCIYRSVLSSGSVRENHSSLDINVTSIYNLCRICGELSKVSKSINILCVNMLFWNIRAHSHGNNEDKSNKKPMEWKYSIKNYITRCFWKGNSMVLITHIYSYALNVLATHANFIFVQKKTLKLNT